MELFIFTTGIENILGKPFDERRMIDKNAPSFSLPYCMNHLKPQSSRPELTVEQQRAFLAAAEENFKGGLASLAAVRTGQMTDETQKQVTAATNVEQTA